MARRRTSPFQLLSIVVLVAQADAVTSPKPQLRAEQMHVFYNVRVTRNENVQKTGLNCTFFSILGFQNGEKVIESQAVLPFAHDYDPSMNLTLNVRCAETTDTGEDENEETLEIRVKGAETARVDDLGCSFGWNYVNCSWSSWHRPPNNTLYTMFYHYRGMAVRECPLYVLNSGLRVGCHFVPIARSFLTEHHFYVNGTSDGGAIGAKYMKVRPSSTCIAESPSEVRASSKDGAGLNVTWRSDCHRCSSEVSVTNNDSGATQVSSVGRGASEWSDASSFDARTRNLSVRVRARLRHECGWSTWSAAVTVEPRRTPDPLPMPPRMDTWTAVLVACAGLILLLFGAATCIITVGIRCKSALWPHVSDPSVIFEELYTKHRGNFQAWAGVPAASSGEPDLPQDVAFSLVVPESDLTKIQQ